MIKLVFWSCLALVAYTYVGYAVCLWLQVRLHRRPVLQMPILPTVSIVIAVRNEETNLPGKLENLRLLNYPQDRLQVVIASDGSTDGTARILTDHASGFLVPVILEASNGKACALNEAVKRATGEVLIFLDARQSIDADAIGQLVSCLADSTVGAASGELLIEASDAAPSDALGIYWKIEKAVRKLESESGSVVGVTGAIYAIRRELYSAMPPGTILDDVFIPMNVARIGKRVVFQPTAIARDRLFSEKGKEFSRKVRTLTGNYQLLRLAPWLLSPANPLLFRFISHKILRLLVPAELILIFVSLGLSGGPFYRIAFELQNLFYLLAIVGAVSPAARRFKPVGLAYTFVMLNTAASLAFYNFLTGRNGVWAE